MVEDYPDNWPRVAGILREGTIVGEEIAVGESTEAGIEGREDLKKVIEMHKAVGKLLRVGYMVLERTIHNSHLVKRHKELVE